MVYGHDFVPNESASFLSLMDQLKAELDLVQTNLVNGSVSLAEDHAARAVGLLNSKDPVNNITWKDEIAERNERIAEELVSAVSALKNLNMSSILPSSYVETNQSINNIDAIIDEALTSRIDIEQRENATIQATALGDIINTLLSYYGDAFAVGFDMGNMSQMASAMGGASSNKSYSLVNVTDYQSAQALAKNALGFFNNELKDLVPTNKTDSAVKLEESLKQLSNLINNKSLPIEVMEIGHTQVHPNLQAAFNLELQMKM
jgi:flagellin-specific chaperone FliS